MYIRSVSVESGKTLQQLLDEQSQVPSKCPVCDEQTTKIPTNGPKVLLISLANKNRISHEVTRVICFGGLRYRLKAFVIHKGTNAGGHYVATLHDVRKILLFLFSVFLFFFFFFTDFGLLVCL